MYFSKSIHNFFEKGIMYKVIFQFSTLGVISHVKLTYQEWFISSVQWQDNLEDSLDKGREAPSCVQISFTHVLCHFIKGYQIIVLKPPLKYHAIIVC